MPHPIRTSTTRDRTGYHLIDPSRDLLGRPIFCVVDGKRINMPYDPYCSTVCLDSANAERRRDSERFSAQEHTIGLPHRA